MLDSIWKKFIPQMNAETEELVVDRLENASALHPSIITANMDESGNLCINNRCFSIRDIQSIELKHSFENKEESGLVEIYVGTVDRDTEALFANTAVKREHIGNALTDGGPANEIRLKTKDFGIPLIEI